MAIAVTFDTHEFIKELRTAGFEERQAEALSVAMRKAQDSRMDELATKGDLFASKVELKDEMVKLDRRMDRLEAEFKLMKWMLALTMAGVTGILTLLAKLLMTLPH